MGRLAGKRAVITGGSRGIGRAVVERFLAEGAEVLTCARGDRPADLPEAVGFQSCDLSRSDQVAALAEAATARWGGLDILVNNAGVQVEKTVPESSDADWEAVMGINAKGLFFCCRAFIPIMAAGGGGSIVNLGSTSALVADASLALYNASKAFVHGLTRSIAGDHGAQGIRCNAIAPGWIMTGMADSAFALAGDPQAAQADALKRHPAGRFGKPEDIAALALWLASDEAAFATGQIYVLDGGLTATSPLQPGLF
ncbi:MAG: SDR family oxidoreductase [Rhodospirillales bacterium]